MLFKTPYADYDVSVVFGRYQNKRIAIELIDNTDGEPVLTATVNIPDAKLEPNEVIIKNWSENEGVLEWLQENGYVGKPIRLTRAGFEMAHIVELLKNN